jgi:hypothetical protein
MHCDNCGYSNEDSNNGPCPECGATAETVRIITPDERDGFQGLTITTPGSSPTDETAECFYENHGPVSRVYVRQINLARSGLLAKLLMGLVFLAFVIFLLPVALVLAVLFGGLAFATRRSR